MHRTLIKKLIYRPKTGTLRAKWLKELKQKEDLKATSLQKEIQGNAIR